MTSTDEILAIAAAAGSGRAELTVEVTEADLAAFRAAAARGAGSDVARALRAIRPAHAGGPPAADPAWTAWLTAAAATAAADETRAADEAGADSGSTESGDRPGTSGAAPVHPAWLAVFAAGTALADAKEAGTPGATPGGVAVTAAVAAGMSAAAVIEAGLDDWGGWSAASVAGTVGAGVTAGLLLGLPEPRLRAAVGICATQAAGLAAAEGTPAYALQVGKAAFNGVEAALLARAGLTAPAEPLDGRRGLFALFGPAAPAPA
jgi:hypothetical protein